MERTRKLGYIRGAGSFSHYDNNFIAVRVPASLYKLKLETALVKVVYICIHMFVE